MSSESDARIIIDDSLRKAGWDPADQRQVRTEVKADLSSLGVADPQIEFSPHLGDGKNYGLADYVLYDSRGRAIAVVEAKKAGIQPYSAKQQALPYAQALGAPFVFLTNGELVYFWDYEQHDARR